MPATEAVPQISVTCWDGSQPARRGARSGQGLSGGDSAFLGSLDEMGMEVQSPDEMGMQVQRPKYGSAHLRPPHLPLDLRVVAAAPSPRYLQHPVAQEFLSWVWGVFLGFSPFILNFSFTTCQT